MNKIYVITLLLISFFEVSASGEKEIFKPEITISVAASSIDILEEVSELYKKSHNVDIRLNPGSSGQLAKQIESGAEPDIFISASKKWIEYIRDYSTEIDPFVSNGVVLITYNSSDLIKINPEEFSPDFFIDKISIGDPEHVPAGAYAKEVLEYYGIYNVLKNRIIPASNVRAALSVVELGECEVGIVYKTDALKSRKVRIITEFPEETHTKIEYFRALLKDSDEVRDFYIFMTENSQVKDIYKKYGFL